MLPASSFHRKKGVGRLYLRTDQRTGTYQLRATNNRLPTGVSLGATYTVGDDSVQLFMACRCSRLKLPLATTFRSGVPSLEDLLTTLGRLVYKCTGCGLLHCAECQTERTCMCGSVSFCPSCAWPGPGIADAPGPVFEMTCGECVTEHMCDDCTQFAWRLQPGLLTSCCGNDRCDACHAAHRGERHSRPVAASPIVSPVPLTRVDVSRPIAC